MLGICNGGRHNRLLGRSSVTFGVRRLQPGMGRVLTERQDDRRLQKPPRRVEVAQAASVSPTRPMTRAAWRERIVN